ncbi:MAG: McrC family protein [Culicoidibacterales bacterium]
MTRTLEIKEFQSIISNEQYQSDKYCYLPEPAFSELITFIEETTGGKEQSDVMDFMSVYRTKNRTLGQLIKVKNYVGVIQLKSGWQIQILPKIELLDQENEGDLTKDIFMKMIRSLKQTPNRISSLAHLKTDKMNIYEIFINMYIQNVQLLVKRGIKSNYRVEEENQRFYKGKLLVSQHVRKNSVHKERFYVAYDQFSQNIAENRIIKATLIKLQKMTTSSQNAKEIRHLLTSFEMIEPTTNLAFDFSQIFINRTMKDYKLIMEWSKVFLLNQSFTSFSGTTVAHAILFPMEKVYESYLTQQIKKQFSNSNWSVTAQDKGYYLFDTPQLFKLRPDVVLRNTDKKKIIIVDMKWKSLDLSKKSKGMASSDMYQMYAYAKKYTTEVTPEVWVLYPQIKGAQTEIYQSQDNVKVTIFFVDLCDVQKSLASFRVEIDK